MTDLPPPPSPAPSPHDSAILPQMAKSIPVGMPVAAVPQPQPQPPQPSAQISIGLREIMIAMGGVVVTVSISVASWFFGQITERLDKHNTRIQILEKDDVTHGHEIKSLKEQSRKQWELLRKQGETLSELRAKVNAGG